MKKEQAEKVLKELEACAGELKTIANKFAATNDARKRVSLLKEASAALDKVATCEALGV